MNDNPGRAEQSSSGLRPRADERGSSPVTSCEEHPQLRAPIAGHHLPHVRDLPTIILLLLGVCNPGHPWPAHWLEISLFLCQRRRRRPHPVPDTRRSEEHTSELQSLMRISYAVFCLTKKQT